MVTMGLSCSVQDKQFFCRKRNLFLPRVFNAPTEGVPSELCNGGWAQNTAVLVLPEVGKSLTTYLIFSTKHWHWSDKQTDTEIPYINIAAYRP